MVHQQQQIYPCAHTGTMQLKAVSMPPMLLPTPASWLRHGHSFQVVGNCTGAKQLEDVLMLLLPLLCHSWEVTGCEEKREKQRQQHGRSFYLPIPGTVPHQGKLHPRCSCREARGWGKKQQQQQQQQYSWKLPGPGATSCCLALALAQAKPLGHIWPAGDMLLTCDLDCKLCGTGLCYMHV